MKIIDKLRKGQVTILGKAIPVTAIILVLLAGTATALLVSYISNTVTVNVSVNSPLLLNISTDNSTWVDTISFGTKYGGDTITIFTRRSL